MNQTYAHPHFSLPDVITWSAVDDVFITAVGGTEIGCIPIFFVNDRNPCPPVGAVVVAFVVMVYVTGEKDIEMC